MLTVTLLYFAALKYVPLAEATALFFLTPIFTTWLSSWLLKEKPTRWAVVAIALGFAGVLVVVRPGSNLSAIGLALVFAAACCNAAYQTLTRAASASLNHGERTSTQLLFAGMVGAISTVVGTLTGLSISRLVSSPPGRYIAGQITAFEGGAALRNVVDRARQY